jgi:hypothetical protein
VQEIEIAFSPMCCGKAEPRDECEQQNENGQGGPINFGHGAAPNLDVSFRGFSQRSAPP